VYTDGIGVVYGRNTAERVISETTCGRTMSYHYDPNGNQRGEIEPYAIQPAFGLLDARVAWTGYRAAAK
jgi:hypothetical protein